MGDHDKGEDDHGNCSGSSSSTIKISSHHQTDNFQGDSFSQAFSFVKHSEFYTPPPPSTPMVTERPDYSSSSSPLSTPLPSLSPSTNRNAILVSHRQKGNPLLKHIRNVRWNFADIMSDYLLGRSSCALYISLRYHLLHSDYLYHRIKELQNGFRLRVVLCHIDVEDVLKPLLEVTRTAILHDCTLLCGWSLEECGRYLETIKIYENKPANIIQGQMDTDYLSRLSHALTAVRHVNKTDVVTLGSTFGCLAQIIDAPLEDLARCPGIGERKVKRLYDTFHGPFKRVISISHAAATTTADEPQTRTDEHLNGKNKEKAGERDEVMKNKKTDSTLKSAISVAFSKYGDRIRKNESNTRQQNDVRKDEAETSVSASKTPKKIKPANSKNRKRKK